MKKGKRRKKMSRQETVLAAGEDIKGLFGSFLPNNRSSYKDPKR